MYCHSYSTINLFPLNSKHYEVIKRNAKLKFWVKMWKYRIRAKTDAAKLAAHAEGGVELGYSGNGRPLLQEGQLYDHVGRRDGEHGGERRRNSSCWAALQPKISIATCLLTAMFRRRQPSLMRSCVLACRHMSAPLEMASKTASRPTLMTASRMRLLWRSQWHCKAWITCAPIWRRLVARLTNCSTACKTRCMRHAASKWCKKTIKHFFHSGSDYTNCIEWDDGFNW